MQHHAHTLQFKKLISNISNRCFQDTCQTTCKPMYTPYGAKQNHLQQEFRVGALLHKHERRAARVDHLRAALAPRRERGRRGRPQRGGAVDLHFHELVGRQQLGKGARVGVCGAGLAEPQQRARHRRPQRVALRGAEGGVQLDAEAAAGAAAACRGAVAGGVGVLRGGGGGVARSAAAGGSAGGGHAQRRRVAFLLCGGAVARCAGPGWLPTAYWH